MTSIHRVKMLKTLGFTQKEILQGQKSATITMNLRRKPNEFLEFDRFRERLESLRRKIHHLMILGRYKKRETRFLLQHVSQEVLDASNKHGTAWSRHHSSNWSTASTVRNHTSSSSDSTCSLSSILKVEDVGKDGSMSPSSFDRRESEGPFSFPPL